MGPEGEQPKPPYHLIDNPDTALEFTDLVFIDPVTTGYSRPAPGEKAAQFHGFDGDLASVAEFIRLYSVRAERWASPKFLAGESYGTTRASALSEYLLDKDGLYLNGITLISAVLNFETISFAPGNELPYALYLPTYTAAAWYHKKLPKDLQDSFEKAIGESRRFAGGEYTSALMKGDKLTAAERTNVTKQLARLTGLSAEFIDESNLRVPPGRFRKELMRKERLTLGRYDSRLTGLDEDAAGARPDYDASYASVQGVYTAMFNNYVRTELKYDTDEPYEVLTDKVEPWSYDKFQNRYVNVAEMLRDGDDAESEPEGDDCSGLLRPGDAVLCHRIHREPHGSGAVAQRPLEPNLLRRGSHALHQAGLPGRPAQGDGRLLPEGATDAVKASENELHRQLKLA